MKFDFTSIIERKGKDAMALDAVGSESLSFAPRKPKEGYDIIPMWVADMNFPTAPSIVESIIERTKHPCYGYFYPREEYFESIIKWHEKRNGIKGLTKECIGYENGVLGGLISAANVFLSKGDKILLHSPTYIGFTGSLKNNGYNIILSPLIKDKNDVWRMDYKDMEEKIIKHKIHATVFCSPHNPCGRVWEREEIERAMEIFKKHDVYVISDEIWSDIICKGHKHIPTQSVSEDAKNRTVALYAPSKTFNLAGLIGSYHIIYNKTLRERILKESSLSHYNDMNVLSMHALIGAYKSEGCEWLEELREIITKNIDYAYDYIIKNFKGITLSKPEGTYMLFVDCEEWCKSHGQTMDELLKRGWDVGVAWQDGRMFHGKYAIRINLALPFTRVKEAFERMNKFVFNK